MGRGRALAFIGITAIVLAFVFQNVCMSNWRASIAKGPTVQVRSNTRPDAIAMKLAICILTRRSRWQRRHLLRQTWLQDEPYGVQVSHIFVMGEDRSYTQEENKDLAEEVKAHGDILIAPVEEASETKSAKTKHCIDWTTKSNDFDVLVKADDDSTLFLSRLFGSEGWLRPGAVRRDELVYFGKRHALARVANPALISFPPQTKEGSAWTDTIPPTGAALVAPDTGRLFEFDYRGIYWPEHMEGGMYGLSRALAEEIAKNNFRAYSSEEATVGVWVSAFGARALYLADGQALSGEADYLASNGTAVAASFGTCPLRLASMWCEYSRNGTLSSKSILPEDVRQALDCLGAYEQASNAPRSLPLGARDRHRMATLESLRRRWPITEGPSLGETGRWWAQMGGAFRGRPAAVVGTSAATIDRLPLYLLEGMHTLVMDDFFRVSERYTSWAPTMYMCVDPKICASSSGSSSGGGGGRREGRRGTATGAVESANRFARDVFAAFYILSGGPEGAEYWRYLRQRVNAHWFAAGSGSGGGGTWRRLGGGGGEGGGRKRRGGENFGGIAGMSPVLEGLEAGLAENSPEIFSVSSQASGLAMSVEVLSFLGFSPIYVTAATEELGSRGAGTTAPQQWEEFSRAVSLARLAYGTTVTYLYADDEDKLPKARIIPFSGSDKRGQAASELAAAGNLNGQEHILTWAERRSHARGEELANWDLDAFARNFPVVSRVDVVPGAASVDGMFPRSPRCRDADDLDRFQKAVICSVRISLKHFSSFLSWHVPYGPVRGVFVWLKR